MARSRTHVLSVSLVLVLQMAVAVLQVQVNTLAIEWAAGQSPIGPITEFITALRFVENETI